jgi:DNA modification methylase/predicted RNA-binding Zn-ribbon protein involved in translation (DUF1610 family)
MATHKKTPLHNETLFSAEEWSRITPGELWYQDPKREQPVTVLGHTFKNDDERRQWFREELRKKLPELKKMEGYPVGEDDDIINLSDPPYYTACPNPWLNDFIAEWEQEKKQLEAEGKRDADAVVTEPYASDVSEGKNNPIYNAHTYPTKVPHPAIMRYILYYTQPGDIIYDGFAGTGMTGVAAYKCGHPDSNFVQKVSSDQLLRDKVKWGERHALLSDISTEASLISGCYNSPLTYKTVFHDIEEALSKLEAKYSWMYSTKLEGGLTGRINYVAWSAVFVCPNCSKEFIFYDTAIDKKTGKVSKEFVCPHCHSVLTKKVVSNCMETIFDKVMGKSITMLKTVPVLINYTIGRKTYDKKPDSEDLAIIERANTLARNYKYASNRMREGSEARRNDRQGITNVHHFFYPRTLVLLEELYKMATTKEFKFLIDSQVINLSKLNRYRPEVSFPYNPLSGTLYIGSLISESNVFVALKNKLRKMLIAFEQLNVRNLTSICSATQNPLKDSTVDYIFTDPPFGANLSYSELNFIQESLLKVITNNSLEAIENQSLHKSRSDYQFLMTASLTEYYRILKPGRWLTIEFSNTSASIWNSIQQAISNSGFVIANVSALDKQQGSFKAVTTTTAVKQDLVISCYKPSDEFTRKMEESADKGQNVWDFIGEHLQHLPVHIERGNATTTVIERSPKILYDRLISYYVQHGYSIPLDAQQFQQGLKERFLERDGMFFTAKQAAEYEEKKAHTSEFVPMGLIVSDEANGIEWLKHELKEPKTYQEISPEWMAAINGVKKGDVLPELKTILDENFIEDEQGKWHVPDLEKAIDLEKLHHKSLMREFNLYKELAQKPRARIREVRVEALREGFKECFKDKDFQTILLIADKIPQNILTEDEQLLQYYDIASMRA